MKFSGLFSILSCPVLSCPIPSWPVMVCLVPACSVPCPVLLCPFLSCLLFCPALSCPVPCPLSSSEFRVRPDPVAMGRKSSVPRKFFFGNGAYVYFRRVCHFSAVSLPAKIEPAISYLADFPLFTILSHLFSILCIFLTFPFSLSLLILLTNYYMF